MEILNSTSKYARQKTFWRTDVCAWNHKKMGEKCFKSSLIKIHAVIQHQPFSVLALRWWNELPPEAMTTESLSIFPLKL